MNRGTGKRKTSIARVILDSKIKGFTVNGKDIKEYFTRETHIKAAMKPLILTKQDGSLGVKATVTGGGVTGQAEALRHGISRALLDINPALREILKPAKLLTRDSRKVERKKPGLKKSRRSPQFSKR